MTIQKAREILGADTADFTDNDIEKLIAFLEPIAKVEYEEFIKSATLKSC